MKSFQPTFRLTALPLMLEKGEYRVLAAGTGEEALGLVNRPQDSVDLLITDIILPAMNGLELAERSSVKLPRLQVFYISGYTADKLSEHGVLEAGTNFLPKPFTLQELLAAIQNLTPAAAGARQGARAQPGIPG